MKKLFTLIIMCFFCLSCGNTNILASFGKENLKESAENDLKNKNYASAKAKLEKLVAVDSTNYSALSLLAACYAAIGGVVIFDTVVTSAFNGTTVDPSSDPFGFTSEVLPASSATLFSQLQLAIDTMSLIPAASLSDEMSFQALCFINIYTLIKLSSLLDTLRQGGSISLADATTLFNNIATGNALSTGIGSGVLSAASVVSTGVTAAPGATPDQQVTNFLTTFI